MKREGIVATILMEWYGLALPKAILAFKLHILKVKRLH